MSQKFKTSTRIPTIPRSIPKPSLLKGAANSLNLNSDAESIKNIRPTFPRTNLRRSKSCADFNPFNTRSNFNIIKPSVATCVKRPIKRPALTETNPTQNKITKVTKSEPAKPAKTIQPKFAPYDYKGRFNHLKEIHEKLKETHRSLKDEHESTADQNEDLLSKNSQIQNDHNKLKKLYDKVSKEYEALKEQQAGATERIKSLQSKSDRLETDLKRKTELFESANNENIKLKEDRNELRQRLTLTEEQLQENLKVNAFMKEELFHLQNEKRKMHNTIQELKGNIRVFCRIRPPLSSEMDKLLYGINYLDETSVELYRTKDKRIEFSFDKVFGPTSTQSEIFEELSQLVQSALDGYNVCVFAYGQTGSGKTYTMEGEGENDSDSRGMIPRSIDSIFITIDNMKKLGWTYTVKASFLEIYNEIIVDLLDPRKNNLDIRMCDAKGTDVYVSNLTIEEIYSAEKLKTLMKIAQRNRAVAATENNERSSRSHSVTKISLEGINEEQGQRCTGNLNLIDLAGSEKFHTNETVRFRETTNINKSLSNLSNVILCLVKRNSHIPYRNSKLTHLLMPSLGGNSKTLMMANISPLEDCYNESVNSLRFASQVNQCKTGSIKRQKTVA